MDFTLYCVERHQLRFFPASLLEAFVAAIYDKHLDQLLNRYSFSGLPHLSPPLSDFGDWAHTAHVRDAVTENFKIEIEIEAPDSGGRDNGIFRRLCNSFQLKRHPKFFSYGNVSPELYAQCGYAVFCKQLR